MIRWIGGCIGESDGKRNQQARADRRGRKVWEDGKEQPHAHFHTPHSAPFPGCASCRICTLEGGYGRCMRTSAMRTLLLVYGVSNRSALYPHKSVKSTRNTGALLEFKLLSPCASLAPSFPTLSQESLLSTLKASFANSHLKHPTKHRGDQPPNVSNIPTKNNCESPPNPYTSTYHLLVANSCPFRPQ